MFPILFVKISGLLVLPAVFLLTSCNLFRTTETQKSVRNARATQTSSQLASVEMIHKVLLQRGVYHKVVRFRYDIGGPMNVPPVGLAAFTLSVAPLSWLPKQHGERERTGIIYRDESNAKQPWWYVDAKTPNPIWLPNDGVEKQIGHAMRKRVELLDTKEYDPATLEKNRATAWPTKPATDWETRFRKVHGTDFDAKSAVDREKMRRLKDK